ncbi:hypothetical protein QYF36_016453 [Acer negundo]|nr:hypothetical protein QYF36_016453 [Acer negundo]
MQKTAAGTLDTAGASSSGGGETPGWIESFDPLRVREQESHKIVLRRLVIACIAVCLLSSVSYATVCEQEEVIRLSRAGRGVLVKSVAYRY